MVSRQVNRDELGHVRKAFAEHKFTLNECSKPFNSVRRCTEQFPCSCGGRHCLSAMMLTALTQEGYDRAYGNEVGR